MLYYLFRQFDYEFEDGTVHHEGFNVLEMTYARSIYFTPGLDYIIYVAM